MTYTTRHELAVDKGSSVWNDACKTRHEGWIHAEGLFDHGSEVGEHCCTAEGDFDFFGEA